MRFCVKCSVCQSQGREYLISFVVCTRIELQRSAKNAARSFVAPEVGLIIRQLPQEKSGVVARM